MGRVHQMKDDYIPKDVMYGELATGHRPAGRPVPRSKDISKRDQKLTGIYPDNWELLTATAVAGASPFEKGLRGKRNGAATKPVEDRKQTQQTQPCNPPSIFV